MKKSMIGEMGEDFAKLKEAEQIVKLKQSLKYKNELINKLRDDMDVYYTNYKKENDGLRDLNDDLKRKLRNLENEFENLKLDVSIRNDRSQMAGVGNYVQNNMYGSGQFNPMYNSGMQGYGMSRSGIGMQNHQRIGNYGNANTNSQQGSTDVRAIYMQPDKLTGVNTNERTHMSDRYLSNETEVLMRSSENNMRGSESNALFGLNLNIGGEMLNEDNNSSNKHPNTE